MDIQKIALALKNAATIKLASLARMEQSGDMPTVYHGERTIYTKLKKDLGIFTITIPEDLMLLEDYYRGVYERELAFSRKTPNPKTGYLCLGMATAAEEIADKIKELAKGDK